jgi:hypothetical protein
MIMDSQDIEGLRFHNIGGEILIYTHNKPNIEVFCEHSDLLRIKEEDGIIGFFYNKDDIETIKKTFVEKIFKKSFKLNLPINSSFIDEKDNIHIYSLLKTKIEVFVPKNLIEYIYMDGNATISGDEFSDYVRVYMSGKNTLRLNNIKNTYIDSIGDSECFVDCPNNLCVYMNGNGFLRVNGQQINSLKLKSKGEVQVDVVGTIIDLNCDVSGMTNIDIYGKVINKQIKRSGICKVTINN